MNPCDELQIALEMRRHGVDPPIAVAELERHVAGCDACAAFVEASRKVESLMEITAPTLDLGAARDLLRRKRRETRAGILVQFALVAVALAMWSALGDPSSSLLPFALVGLLWWGSARHARRLEEEIRAELEPLDELVTSLRRRLDTELRDVRGTIVLVVAATAGLFLLRLLLGWPFDPWRDLGALAGLGGLIAFFEAGRRQLVRERAQLGGDPMPGH